MLTWLRIAATCFCIVLCVLLTALWLRSYATGDALEVMRTSMSVRTGGVILRHRFRLLSDSGVILMQHFPKGIGFINIPQSQRDKMNSEVFYHRASRELPFTSHTFGFALSQYELPKPRTASMPVQGFVTSLAIPHWLLILISGSLVMASKPTSLWRFSIRQLSIATAIFAIIFWVALTL
jgi:hypothetical protein